MLFFEGGCVQAWTSQGDRFRWCQEPMWACSQQLRNKSRIGETKGALEHLLRPDDKWSSEMIVWPEWKFNVSAEQLGWQWPWWRDLAGLRASAELRPSAETWGSHWSLQTGWIQPVSVEVTDYWFRIVQHNHPICSERQHCCVFSGGRNMHPCGLLRCLRVWAANTVRGAHWAAFVMNRCSVRACLSAGLPEKSTRRWIHKIKDLVEIWVIYTIYLYGNSALTVNKWWSTFRFAVSDTNKCT